MAQTKTAQIAPADQKSTARQLKNAKKNNQADIIQFPQDRIRPGQKNTGEKPSTGKTAKDRAIDAYGEFGKGVGTMAGSSIGGKFGGKILGDFLEKQSRKKAKKRLNEGLIRKPTKEDFIQIAPGLSLRDLKENIGLLNTKEKDIGASPKSKTTSPQSLPQNRTTSSEQSQPSGAQVIPLQQPLRVAPEQEQQVSKDLKLAQQAGKATEKAGQGIKTAGSATKAAGSATKAVGTTAQAAGAGIQAGGAAAEMGAKGAKYGAKAAGAVAKGAGVASKGIQQAGSAMAKAGAALSSTGLGAIVGVPLAALGGVTAGAGAAGQAAAKAGEAGAKVAEKGAAAAEKGAKKVRQAGKKVSEKGKQIKDKGQQIKDKGQQIINKGQQVKNTGQQIQEMANKAALNREKRKARRDMGLPQGSKGGIPGMPKGTRGTSPKMFAQPKGLPQMMQQGQKGQSGQTLDQRQLQNGGQELAAAKKMGQQKRSELLNQREESQFAQALNKLEQAQGIGKKVKAIREAWSGMTKIGSAYFLQAGWAGTLELTLTSVFWLSLGWVNFHFIMKYIVNSEKFCEFGEESTLIAKSGATMAQAATGTEDESANKNSNEATKSFSATLKWIEIIGMFFLDIFSLIIVSLFALVIIIPVLLAAGAMYNLISLVI